MMDATGPRQREDGAVFAYTKGDGSAYALPREEYPRLKQEWMAGRAFFEGRSFYGAPMIIKLGDIVAISDNAPEHMRAMREDRAEDDREDAIQS